MKLLTAISLGVALLAATGCYSTQEGRTKVGIPWATDTIESRYERPLEQVFAAAKDTLAFNGTPTGENTIAKTLAASIDNRTVWIKVDAVDNGVTRILVQVRKSGGRSDIHLASELDKQIALRLR